MVEEESARPPIRVLYSFPHPLGDPGIGTTAYHQILGLVARGVDVTVCCTSLSRPLPDAVPVIETMVAFGRRVPHRLVGVDRTVRYHDRLVARVLRRGRHVFDVVHTWPQGAAETLDVARRVGVAGVRESPNAYTAEAYRLAECEARLVGISMAKGQSHRFDRRRLDREEREFDLAAGILGPSDFVERSFTLRRGVPVRILRHQYGFDPERFPRPPDARGGGPFTLVFVGRGEPRKGLHYALRAWRASGAATFDARFLICGDMLPDYRKVLAPWLEDPGVEVLPFDHDVGRLLRSADALVLPSVEEGSALVTYEAQASGCALLVSESTGALMTDGLHGFVHSPGDVVALTGHLRRLVQDADLLAAIRAQVLEHRSSLTWSSAAARLESAYRSVVDS